MSKFDISENLNCARQREKKKTYTVQTTYRFQFGNRRNLNSFIRLFIYSLFTITPTFFFLSNVFLLKNTSVFVFYSFFFPSPVVLHSILPYLRSLFNSLLHFGCKLQRFSLVFINLYCSSVLWSSYIEFITFNSAITCVKYKALMFLYTPVQIAHIHHVRSRKNKKKKSNTTTYYSRRDEKAHDRFDSKNRLRTHVRLRCKTYVRGGTISVG